MVQSQPGQTVRKTLYQNKTKQNKKNPSQNRARGVAQGESPEFNPSSSKKKKKKNGEKAWVSVAHACHPSYSGGRDQEDHGSKPVRQTACETLS
jgi:ribosomal protein L31